MVSGSLTGGSVVGGFNKIKIINKITSVVIPDPKFFFLEAASIADTDAVNPYVISRGNLMKISTLRFFIRFIPAICDL